MTDRDDEYTDNDLLHQIRAECSTALRMDAEHASSSHPGIQNIAWPKSARTLLEGFIKKIDVHQRGEKWWEPE